jgi:uncharacterized protein YchJ
MVSWSDAAAYCNWLSEHEACPCGSGEKYNHCCYGKDVEDDPGRGSGQRQPQ